MKLSNFSKLVGASVIAASVAILPLYLPASAQTNTDTTTTPNTTTGTTTEDKTGTTIDTTPFQESENDRNPNFGWLGLLGLIGLANLFRKPKTTVYSDPDVTTRTTNRY